MTNNKCVQLILKSLQLLPVVALGLLTSCSSPKSCCCCSGSAELFNGKDLAGWQAVSVKDGVKLEDVWSVRDGYIVCKGDPLGYIHTQSLFTDYTLELEWRWAPGSEPGNSGVFLRINGEPRGLPRCIEAQLKSGDAGDLYGFHGMKIDGDAARRIEKKGHELGGDFIGVKKIAGNEKPAGEWNRYELVVRGSNLTVSVNGKQVNAATGCEVVAGPIGLQSEGGEIHFRKIRLTR